MRKIIDWFNRLTARRSIIKIQQEHIDQLKEINDAQAATIKQLNEKLDTLRTGVSDFLGRIDEQIG